MAKILIVDDRSINRQFLVTLLGYSGHQLQEASNGAEALDLVRAEQPDLVITDIVMPVMDGYEFAQQLQADSTVAQTPVIFYTATYRVADATKLAKKCGVSRVIPKPSEPEAILRIVNDVLNLTPELSAAPSSVNYELHDSITGHLTEHLVSLQALNQKLAQLIELGLELAGQSEPQQLCALFINGARNIINAEYAALGILEPDKQTLRYYLTSVPGKTAEIQTVDLLRPEGGLAQLIVDGQALRVSQHTGDIPRLDLPADYLPVRSFVGLPLATASKVYGWFYLVNKTNADEFSEPDERLLMTLAAQMAVAYENLERYQFIEGQTVQLQEEITERKQAENRFRGLLEAAPDAMLIVDEQGRIIMANAQTERMFGYNQSKLIGQSVDIFVPERFRTKHWQHRTGFLINPQVRSMGVGLELYAVCQDGGEIPVEISLSPYNTENGLLVTAAIRDISQRKESEARLALQARQLAQSNVELAAANRELETFSYTVSHDLRAPLRRINMLGHFLVEDSLDKLNPETQEYLQEVRTAVDQMNQLIDDILHLSRVAQYEMQRETVELSGLAHTLLARLQQESPERQISWDIADNLVVEGDKRLLQIALENLLSNAWKYTGKQTEALIEFGMTNDKKQATYYIRDNGAGFDMAYAHKLFAPFERIHHTDDFEGTGVGLATVQRIIERHGGQIWAEAEEGQGATFFFYLS